MRTENKIKKNVVYLALALIDWLHPNIAAKISKIYWMTSDKVHGNTSWAAYNFYYKQIKSIMRPSKSDSLLDAACGIGEITYLFHKDGYNIEGFDMSDYLICKAKLSYPSICFYVHDLLKNGLIHKKFHKILVNNAIFYIHPKFLSRVIANLYAMCSDNEIVYILDWPDFSKRKKILSQMTCLFTSLIPVYQPTLGGFWYKKEWIENIAYKIGFNEIEFLDSWANYRTHAILKR